MITKSVRDYK